MLPAYEDDCTTSLPAAVSTVRLEENGFIFALPYSDAWGSPPYVRMEDEIHFGPPVSFDDGSGGCAKESAFWMKFTSKRGAEEAAQDIVANYESHAMPTPDDGWGVEIVLVDRRAAVQWGIGDWGCPMPTLEIPGSEMNVELHVSCHYPKTPLEAADELQEFMRAMSFVE